MRTKLFLLFSISIFININAQIGFKEHILTEDVPYPQPTYSVDVDNDGDFDVLAIGSGVISWFENIDGQGSFGIQNIIEEGSIRPKSISAADMDNDGDMDVVCVIESSKIFLYENLDGKGTFGTKERVTDSTRSRDFFFLTDVDGDNDIDVLFAEDQSGVVDGVFCSINVGPKYGLISTWALRRHSLGSTSDFFRHINGADIDNDGDDDAVFSYRSRVLWSRNNLDNGGLFGTKEIASYTNIGDVGKVYPADIDNDGDMDVVSVVKPFQGSGSDRLVWYENRDGLGDFGSEKVLYTNDKSFTAIYTSDIDNDGDIDIIASSAFYKTISVYINVNGNGSSWAVQEIMTSIDNVRSISTGDINKDGKIDIIVSSLGEESKISWLENLGLVNNEISGTIRLDVNSNGCDISDISMPNIMIITENDANSLATLSSQNGGYQLFPDIGDFTTKISSTLPNYYSVTPSSYISNFADNGNSDTVDFCLVPNQAINDLNITILPTSEARPGFNSSYQLVFHNVGTTQLNGNVILEFDDTKLNFLIASETVSTQTVNSLTFNYSNLNPFETRTINLSFNLIAPPTTNIDDILSFAATITPVSGDNTGNDNVFELSQTVIGSYDPNDIQVLEGSQVLIEESEEYLHYIIRFQNTGTADAINVRVENILDPNLDWDTIQLESYSHDNRVEIKDGNQVSFIFNGIYLPDSTNDEPNSHGFIAYKIKPKDGITVGEIMQNKADIYFDFNLPIITNTVSTQVTSALGIDENKVLTFIVSPNPTEDILNVESQSVITKLELYNNLGQVVISALNKNQIDISSLNTGLYFIKIEDGLGNTETKKVIKK